MERYPLMFTFRDLIEGNGFLAEVNLSGRLLMVREKNEWWAYGVQPGAIAETGETPQETYLRFRNSYRMVLFDIAIESSDFGTFKAEVESFFEPDEEEECRWKEAVEAIRSGEIQPEPPFSSLPRQAPESRAATLSVERVDAGKEFAASGNILDRYEIAAPIDGVAA